MSIKPNQDLIIAFINAVNTWKAYVIALRLANKRNNHLAKSGLGKAVFKWRKYAEELKRQIDSLRMV
jgi:hypothetical protein